MLIKIGEPRYSTSSSTTSPIRRTRSTSDSPVEPQTTSSSEPSCSVTQPPQEPFPSASPCKTESDSLVRSTQESAETTQERQPWLAKPSDQASTGRRLGHLQTMPTVLVLLQAAARPGSGPADYPSILAIRLLGTRLGGSTQGSTRWLHSYIRRH